MESPPIKAAGLPHSEIPGSTHACLLPEAYRSLPRPSSPAGAKASIVRPYTLNRRKTIVLGIRCNSQTMQLSKNKSAWRRIHVPAGRSLRNSLDLERHTRYRITLVGVPGIEPGTSSLSGMRSNQLSYTPDTVPSSPARPPHPRGAQDGGGNRNRTGDLMLAKHVLYQLSYAPKFCVTGRRSKQVRSE